ncbi:MAG: peptidylprolyl isomerase [Bryobacteraceae bacterium]
MALIVNGEEIDDAVLRQEAAAIRPQYEAAMEEMDPVDREIQLREWSRENVIERVLLRQEAERDPQPIDAGLIDRALEQMKTEAGGRAACDPSLGDGEIRREIETRLRLDRLIGSITAKVAPPRPKEVGDYYKKNRDRFVAPEVVHAAHIVKNVDENTSEEAAREAIGAIGAELAAGADFAALADRASDCPGRGGDLGWFPRGQMVDEFDAVVFAQAPGSTSAIFRTPFGFHIARVVERRPEGLRDFAEVKDEIEEALLRQRQQEAVEQLVDRLRAQADIRNERGRL